ncbi:DNA glycosylase AlkZ-like family protein [Sulfobacillus harzensis]|uniref:Winged helix DNA-binding domain-containing protein n=1 Tax=Sulfobacillus harzensis TaxID=2729629 RepID=A0A7Y0L6C2_9FIRM|nr:crosslink repair DNA glycosylase YcaQ family protein [Sulfobacillus harzensis]NMP24134.1 winged helix DNA-binding domain-containing protein [Sulfobacillus harzensis]
MNEPRFAVTRAQILSFRRRAGALEERLPAASLRRAAWAGLQDSMPRAALLSIHARVQGTTPSTWEDPALVQLWGPRFNVFVVSECDRAVFSLGTLPDDAQGQQRAEDLAARLRASLGDRRIPYGEAGHVLGVHPNRLRYAAATGTVLIRWEGARQPTIWTVPAPPMKAREARLELARRYLHVYGPTTPEAFGEWAGIGLKSAARTFDALCTSLTPVRTPIGDRWILHEDKEALRSPLEPSTSLRLLPSGDPYLLLQGADRDLMIPQSDRRGALWTPRVWPGGLLLGGEIVGTWRRAGAVVTVQPWRQLSGSERAAVESEVDSLPLPGVEGRPGVRWEG